MGVMSPVAIVTVADAALPVPAPLVPVTLYWVVTASVTVQVLVVDPAQVPPVQMYEVAAGLQVAVKVEVPFLRIEAGAAVSVHTGTLAATPVPLNDTLCGLFIALPVTLTAPILVPAAVGVKRMLKWQAAPAAKSPAQPVTTKSAGLVVTTMLEMVRVALPVLFNTRS